MAGRSRLSRHGKVGQRSASIVRQQELTCRLSLHSVSSYFPLCASQETLGLSRAGDASVRMLFFVSLSQSAAAGRGIASLECVYGNYVPMDVQR